MPLASCRNVRLIYIIMKDSHVTNQHYVPQFLLRKFCSSEEFKLWSYDKKWNKIEERSISKVAYEKHFYDIVKGQKENSFEYVMQKAESDAAPIIDSIISFSDLSRLTIDERCIISLFFVLQLHRTKSNLNQVADFNEQLKGFINQGPVNFANDETFMNSRDLWLSTFDQMPELAKYLMRKKWFLLKSSNQFYTSDNPVVLQNVINNRPNRGNLGLNSEGVEIYCPLSPSLTLCLACEKSFGEIPYTLIYCNYGQVERINSLQVFYSDRFVFASSNDFDLAVDMLSKGECINQVRSNKL